MKARIFVGSSVESLHVANAIQENLEFDANVTIWNQGIFQPSSNALDDLIDSLNNFDFGIFIFQPDDITMIRNNTKNTVRDNVIFELGLFIGKLGKKRVFFVSPRDIEDFHIPTDLLGVTRGMYDGKRDDGNINAALGPFCNMIRQGVKKHTYENLNDLLDESNEAKRLAIEMPYAWEHLLAAEMIESRLVNINQSYNELEKGLVFSKTKNYTGDAYKNWFVESIADIGKLTQIVPLIMKELNESFGPLGIPAKILDIKKATDKIQTLCKELLAWEYRVQEARPPEELDEIQKIMSGWSKVIINTINQLPGEIRRVINLSQGNNIEKDNLKVRLNIEMPQNMDRTVEIFSSYFASQT